MDPFDFQAPQFYERLDLKANKDDDKEADTFFDIQPEDILPKGENRGEVLNEKENRPVSKAKRRSFGIQAQQTDSLHQKLKKEKEKLTFDGILCLNEKSPNKKHGMLTRNDVNVKTPKLELRNRTIKRETLKRSAASPTVTSANKFMAFPESVHHYEHDTPPRFKTKPKPKPKTPNRFVFPVPHSFTLKVQKPEQSECFRFKAKYTKPQPFSFDERDRQRRFEKDKKLEQRRTEETQVPVFQARRTPSFISNTTCSKNNSTCNSFIPKKHLKPLTEPIDVQLKTAVRALERQKFENHLKEKDAKNEEYKKENDEILKSIEQEEIARLRNEIVHRPKPLPKFYNKS